MEIVLVVSLFRRYNKIYLLYFIMVLKLISFASF